MKQVYLDSAATTQMRPEVIEEMARVMKEVYGNPSSTHGIGRSAKTIMERARKNIAKLINAKPSEIIFTSGGTEADNLVLNSAVRDLHVERIITSKIEHHAVVHAVEELKEHYNIEVDYVNLDERGFVDYNHLETLLKGNSAKTIVSLMHVNNEIGNILDIDRVASLCKEYKVLFHSDTVQSIGHLQVDFKKTPVDFAAVSAHKFHGPKGIGFAFVREGIGLKPLIFGGSQEKGLRAGTEGIHNIIGMEKALTMAYENFEEDRAYMIGLKSYFINRLKVAVPGVKFNGGCGDLQHSTYTVINANLPVSEEKTPLLQFQLDLKGIACSKGSACQSGSNAGSHVLNTVSSPEDLSHPSIRFSLSSFNTKEDIDYAVEELKLFLDELKKREESVAV